MDTLLLHLQATFYEIAHLGTTRLSSILPQIVLAVGALIAGWLIASVLQHVTVRLLKLLAIDKLIAKTPLHTALKELGASRGPAELIGRSLFWITMLVTLLVVSDLLDIKPLTQALRLVVSYLPQVIAAVVILILGMLFARLLQVLVTQAVARMGTGYERAAGKAVQAATLAIVLLVASEQLGFNLSFLTTNISIIVSCVLLTAGLAVALGARPLVENALLLRQVQRQIRVGDRIEAGPWRGRVEAFTTTGVVLSDGGRHIAIPAAVLALHPFVIEGREVGTL